MHSSRRRKSAWRLPYFHESCRQVCATEVFQIGMPQRILARTGRTRRTRRTLEKADPMRLQLCSSSSSSSSSSSGSSSSSSMVDSVRTLVFSVEAERSFSIVGAFVDCARGCIRAGEKETRGASPISMRGVAWPPGSRNRRVPDRDASTNLGMNWTNWTNWTN